MSPLSTTGGPSILYTPLYHIGSQGIPITMTITNHTLLLPDAMIVTVEYLTIKVSLLGHTVTLQGRRVTIGHPYVLGRDGRDR